MFFILDIPSLLCLNKLQWSLSPVALPSCHGGEVEPSSLKLFFSDILPLQREPLQWPRQ